MPNLDSTYDAPSTMPLEGDASSPFHDEVYSSEPMQAAGSVPGSIDGLDIDNSSMQNGDTMSSSGQSGMALFNKYDDTGSGIGDDFEITDDSENPKGSSVASVEPLDSTSIREGFAEGFEQVHAARGDGRFSGLDSTESDKEPVLDEEKTRKLEMLLEKLGEAKVETLLERMEEKKRIFEEIQQHMQEWVDSRKDNSLNTTGDSGDGDVESSDFDNDNPKPGVEDSGIEEFRGWESSTVDGGDIRLTR